MKLYATSEHQIPILKILCIIFLLRYEGIKTADDLADFVNAEAGDDNSVTESWYI